MDVLVVYETMFGNTKEIAEAIAEGLAADPTVTVTTRNVVDAPREIGPDIDLLVLGGPTHVFSMSRISTRRSAVMRGATGTGVGGGIREWIEGLPPHPGSPLFAGFDTRADVPLLPGAASRSVTRVAKHHGFLTADPESFLVEGYEGPLADGEVDRAREWGRRLARLLPTV